ncbi:glycosyltransferase family 39 protein [Amycolatopsis rhizosphaerae]|uniref:Glycosyltransferase family 39 protein n=2 Tax=Amycolatopsis rhizosphaerae TaxID=2053003 RepID=A0A558DLD8_9PSEU|nr:glycosyltransferase family 39 protein [Amycolatopsis rhizosphaerae]
MSEASASAGPGEPDATRVSPQVAWKPVSAVLAVAGVVHLGVAARFGWHRDEFYYVISGRHLAWGYPDQPPLTPLLARLAADLPGGVLPLRLLAIAAQLGCVLLAALLAAEFGGRARAQAIAAGAVAASPVFVAGAMLFGTTVTDQLAWAALFVTVARAVRLGTVRAWLPAGVVAGIGLENKYTVGVLLVGIVLGLALYRRAVLRTPGPWLAGVLAAVMLAPNLVWNAQHSWAQFRMAAVLSAEQGGPLGALAQLPVAFASPLIVLWVLGIRWLGSPAGRDHRWVLVVAVTAVLVFTASGGKGYYPAPVLIGLFAAGAVLAEALATQPRTPPVRRHRWQLPAVITASGVLAVLIGLPVLPVGAADALRPVNPQPLETYGWPEFVRQVTAVADTLPAGASVFTSNYGEAGALTILGPAEGLRLPVSSGHNGYLLWGPPSGTPDTVLCVGEWNADYLHRFWSDVREIARITMPGGIVDEETAHHAAIYLCRQPHGDWAQLWPGLRHLN